MPVHSLLEQCCLMFASTGGSIHAKKIINEFSLKAGGSRKISLRAL